MLEVLKAIREIDKDVPILMITAATELEYVIQSVRAGANGLTHHKHRASEELVEAIRKVAAGEIYLHPETAMEIAQQLHQNEPALPHDRLSEREFEIFRLLAMGRAVKEIAGDLGISTKTVATYVSRIREKTNLGSYVNITPLRDPARSGGQHGLVASRELVASRDWWNDGVGIVPTLIGD